jgi:glutathione S-transferase
MLELYQFEECPFCARVRQALDALGLDYVVRTVPRAHPLRERVKAVSGQTQVPVLVDPDRRQVVVESEDIIEYLGSHYRHKET